jgi:NAD(P)-dependent dehydrogenase (short-subunit alcohol dehydrogenase family)
MRRLEGKRAVVTGGGSGVGRASAIRFAREGAAVLVVGRLVNTNETVEAIHAEGGVASGRITDASKEENVAAIVERCVSELGGLEVFFANRKARSSILQTRVLSKREFRQLGMGPT